MEILIKKYYRDIYTYCFCRVEDRQTAQDLTQEVFLRFLQNLDSYEHTGKLKNYLYVTAGNLIKDHYKKRKEDVWEDEKIQQTADKLSAGTENISDRLTLQEIIRPRSCGLGDVYKRQGKGIDTSQILSESASGGNRPDRLHACIHSEVQTEAGRDIY